MLKIQPIEVGKIIVDYCIKHDIKFVFISGNGGAGKTELSKILFEEAIKRGNCNLIDMDDFVVDTRLRNSSKVFWLDPTTGIQKEGKYTTSFAASYFLQNVNAILCNLRRGNNYWHWPKKALSESESVVEYKANSILTIIEGVGTVFLNKESFNNSVSIFLRCDSDIEISRRIKRARFSNEQDSLEVRKRFEERNSQFKANILPYASSHDLILESLDDFCFSVIQDNLNILL